MLGCHAVGFPTRDWHGFQPRRWAGQNGLKVSERGQIGVELMQQYEAAAL